MRSNPAGLNASHCLSYIKYEITQLADSKTINLPCNLIIVKMSLLLIYGKHWMDAINAALSENDLLTNKATRYEPKPSRFTKQKTTC